MWEPAPAQTSLMGTRKLPRAVAAALRSNRCPALVRQLSLSPETVVGSRTHRNLRSFPCRSAVGVVADPLGRWHHWVVVRPPVPRPRAQPSERCPATGTQPAVRKWTPDAIRCISSKGGVKFAGPWIPDEGHPSFPPPESPLLLPQRLGRVFLCSLGPSGRAISGRLKRLSLWQRLNVNQLCHLLARRGSARPRRKGERTKTAKCEQPPAETWCVGAVSFRPPSHVRRTQAIPAVWCRVAEEGTRESCRTSRQLDYRKRNLKAGR